MTAALHSCLARPACQHPDQVQRRNGTKVKLLPKLPAKEEITETLKLFYRPEFMFVIPYFLYVTWSLPYIGSYMSLYFSVRSRALASLVTAIAQVVSTMIMSPGAVGADVAVMIVLVGGTDDMCVIGTGVEVTVVRRPSRPIVSNTVG